MINDKMGMRDEIKLQVGRKIASYISLRGVMIAELFGADGELKERREVRNTVTTLAHNMAAGQILAAPSIVTPGWMELGTGSGQGAGDSILDAFIAGSRTVLDSKTRANAIVTMICTFAAGVGTGAVTEAGIFNVVTQNTTDLLTYADFAVVNKTASDSLVIAWTLTFA